MNNTRNKILPLHSNVAWQAKKGLRVVRMYKRNTFIPASLNINNT